MLEPEDNNTAELNSYHSAIEFTSHAPSQPSERWSAEAIQNWHDPKWQLRNRINSLHQLEKHINLTEEERSGIILSGNRLAMSITPHFLQLIDKNNPNCPIRRQIIPRIEESFEDPQELVDPCGEDSHMPVPGLVHRYPDRVLFLVTDRCASYCRYCTRSRIVSGAGKQKLEPHWEGVFEYLENTPTVRDVLLSGGDPLLFSDDKLESIISRLHAISHIQFIRIGTRFPIFMPQRITSSLCDMLKKYHPLFISIHANHPKELTSEVKTALGMLADAGIPLGNQSVLLKGVNDDTETQRALVHKLLMCRARPYYLYQCDLIKGSSHLRTSVAKGLEIIESLRGHTSGYAIPQYVIDSPGGGGKIPLNPNYILQQNDQQVTLRNYEGKKFIYPEPSNIENELDSNFKG